MKIFSTLKQLVLFKPLVMQFSLEKVYYRKEHHMNGTFHLQANQNIDIVSIALEVFETLRISKENSERVSLGSKVFRKSLTLNRFEKHAIDFDFAVSFPRTTKWEQKTYKGDLGPLNKATDKAKKQLYTYSIVAIVKEKGKKDPLVFEEKIIVE